MNKTQIKEKNPASIHKNHRQRLLKTMLEVDLKNLSKIQQVEIMLFSAIPRGDVNPTAHALLDRYGSFAGILDANINDLKTVHGVGPATATKIKALRQMLELYSLSRLDKKVSLKDNTEFLDILETLLRFLPVEKLFIFAIGNNHKILGKRVYSMSKVREVGIAPTEIFNFISSTNCAHILFAHNHPDGSASASDDDHNAIKYINKLLENFDCDVLDSVVVGTDGIYSENKGGFLRNFNKEFVLDDNNPA